MLHITFTIMKILFLSVVSSMVIMSSQSVYMLAFHHDTIYITFTIQKNGHDYSTLYQKNRRIKKT